MRERNPYPMPDPDLLARVRSDRKIDLLLEEVETMAAYVRRTDVFCHACAYERWYEPRLLSLVGWGRGFPPRTVSDPDPDAPLFTIHSGTEAMAEMEEREKTRVPATSDTERWLRTAEAWDVVGYAVLHLLWERDPGNGHGFHRGPVKPEQTA